VLYIVIFGIAFGGETHFSAEHIDSPRSEIRKYVPEISGDCPASALLVATVAIQQAIASFCKVVMFILHLLLIVIKINIYY
jgi:hypothetical protein